MTASTTSIPKLCKKLKTPFERVSYLKKHPITLESRIMRDESKARGGIAPISKLYRPICGNVRIGEWHHDPDIALRDARRLVNRWDGSIHNRKGISLNTAHRPR